MTGDEFRSIREKLSLTTEAQAWPLVTFLHSRYASLLTPQ